MHTTQASVFSLNIPGCSTVPTIPVHCPGSILYPAQSKADLPSPYCWTLNPFQVLPIVSNTAVNTFGTEAVVSVIKSSGLILGKGRTEPAG